MSGLLDTVGVILRDCKKIDMAAEDEVLALESRRDIYNFIQRYPGAYPREIERGVNMPLSVIDHHLRYLEKNEMVGVDFDGYYKRYYPIKKIDYRDRKIISLMRQKNPRRITIFLMMEPHATYKKILKMLDVSPSTVSFHLKKLRESGIIEQTKINKENVYYVTDKERIAKILVTYKSSFVDNLVDRFVDVWLEVR